MTCIAWDGKTLAADRQTTAGGLKGIGHKIVPLPSGEYLAHFGCTDRALELTEWYSSGADPENFPPTPDDDGEKAGLIVVSPCGTVKFFYGDKPFALPVYEKFYAWGCGNELAIGAMAAGADAYKAVQIASEHNCYCGGGVDAYLIVT
jgi:hypothetical protein